MEQVDRRDKGEQAVVTWVEWLARFGYAAKGIVYIIVGILAVQVAVGSGGRTTGASGALEWLSDQAFGAILLIVIAVGLFGYALWRLVEAWTDPDNEGTDFKGLATRAGRVVSGLVYAALGIEAVRIALGLARGGSDDQAETWTAMLMAQPFGVWLVAGAGVILLGFAFAQFYRAYSADFHKELNLHEMSAVEQTWATRAGRMGYAARGVVYVIIGVLLFVAAWQANPQQAAGFGEALRTLLQQPYGPWLLALVGLGLAAYGVFALVLARYRRIFITD